MNALLLNSDTCASELAPILHENPDIQGPHETAYGMGFRPTLSFWRGPRRFHLYDGEEGSVAIELADRRVQMVLQRHTRNAGEIRQLFQLYLVEEHHLDDLTHLSWTANVADQDKFIPHPPNTEHPANFAPLLEGTHSSAATSSATVQRPWWKFWRV
ncbi:MAG: hypothetical protein ACAI34_09730 [Verrucomicrobium sp.]|nr:hypothetical protein [Verrucomicrobium sp.]